MIEYPPSPLNTKILYTGDRKVGGSEERSQL
jgi:hypothetical protein